MGFLAFPDTIGTGLGPLETNLEHLKSYFCSSARGTKKNSQNVGKDFIFRSLDSDFRNPHPILHKNSPLDLVSLITNLKTRSLIWHFFIVKLTAGPV